MIRDFGRQLKLALARENKRQLDVAKEIGISKVTVCKWVAGTHIPSAYNMEKLKKILPTLEILIDGE